MLDVATGGRDGDGVLPVGGAGLEPAAIPPRPRRSVAVRDTQRPAADRLAMVRRHVQDGVPLSDAATAAGVSIRTAGRWVAAYRAGGPARLARAGRSDRGRRRFPAELVAAVEGLVLRKPPPSVATVYRQAVAVATRKGWPVPSYSTVYSIIAGLGADLTTLAQQGGAAYRDRFELVYRRESAHSNDVWQADHTELDVMVLDGAGRPARPWLTVVLDDHSRVVAGYTVFLGDPTAIGTALALRQAIWRKTDPRWPVCGLPSVLYCDHGTDFVSEHIVQVCVENGIDLVHSTVGVPRGRGKGERIFGTITTELLPTLPGYIPHGTHGVPVTPPGLSLSELDAAVGEFIVGDYHLRPHSETGQSPVTRWTAGGWLPRMPESLEALDLLLLTVATPRKGQVVPTPRAEPRRHGASQENLFPEPELCRYSNADRETTLPRFVAGFGKCQVSALRNSSHLP